MAKAGSRNVTTTPDGVQLAVTDFGGEGPGALLIHGLGGHAAEWAGTAAWLSERFRVVAFDTRGHGESSRDPADASQAAHAADAALVIEDAGLAPAVVMGQSLGGQTALVLAASRPELVSALVVAEAGPDGGDPGDLETLGERLEAWAAENERRHGLPWPRHDVAVMTRTLRTAASRSYWDEWTHIRCPILVVRAEKGGFEPGEVDEMVRRGNDVRLAEIPNAGHDVHLDAPDHWRRTVTDFLA